MQNHSIICSLLGTIEVLIEESLLQTTVLFLIAPALLLTQSLRMLITDGYEARVRFTSILVLSELFSIHLQEWGVITRIILRHILKPNVYG